MHDKPVVLLDPDGHYDGLLRWLRGLGEGGFLHPATRSRGSLSSTTWTLRWTPAHPLGGARLTL